MQKHVAAIAIVIACLLPSFGASACQPTPAACERRVVVFPIVTPEGLRIGTVETMVRPPLSLEVSRFTGDPLTVVFNNPRSSPDAIEPGMVLMPLPHVGHFRTQAVYPKGY